MKTAELNHWQAIHSSKRHDWQTPDGLFNSLSEVFDFELDAAASLENKKCARFFSVELDALKQSWQTSGWVWVNPPYGKGVGKWFDKAIVESEKGAKVVMMCMACTETKWFQSAWNHCAEIWFLTPRVRFVQLGEKTGAAPKGSALFIFDRVHVPRVIRVFNWRQGEWIDNAEVVRKFGF